MTERQREMNVKLAVNFMEEIKMLASSAFPRERRKICIELNG